MAIFEQQILFEMKTGRLSAASNHNSQFSILNSQFFFCRVNIFDYFCATNFM
jgi:hypothetical protein